MSKMSNTASHHLTPKQWGAVTTAGISGAAVAGPVGAAAAALGMATGCVAANYLGWEDSSSSSGDS